MNRFSDNDKKQQGKRIRIIQTITFSVVLVMLIACILLYVASLNEMPSEDIAVQDGLWLTKTEDGWVVIRSEKNNHTELVIPESINGVPVIGIYGLSESDSVQRLFISKNIKSISEQVFDALPNLSSIEVDEENDYYISIDGVLYDSLMYTLIKVPPQYGGSVRFTISEGITYVYDNAFADNKNIVSVVFPSTIIAIGDRAFAMCLRLTEVILGSGSSLRSIGDEAFYGCVILKSFDLPGSISEIGTGVFYGCSSVSAIRIESGGKYYSSDGVLYSEDTLVIYPCGKQNTQYEVLSGIKNIGKYAFCGNKYIMCLVVPESVTYMDMDAFSRCYAMNAVILGCKTPPQLEGWPGYYQDIGFFVDETAYELYISASVWSELNIFSAYMVKDYAYIKLGDIADKDDQLYNSLLSYGATDEDCVIAGFWGGTEAYIASSVTLDGVQSRIVGYMPRAFNSYTITDIYFGGNILMIGDKDFYGFELLKYVLFGENTVYIGKSAFKDCTGLRFALFDVADKSYDKNIYIGENAFEGCSALYKVVLPDVESGEVLLGANCFVLCNSLKEVWLYGVVIAENDSIIAESNNLLLVVAERLKGYYLSEEVMLSWGVESDRVITVEDYNSGASGMEGDKDENVGQYER